MNAYEAKQEDRRERLEARAVRARCESEAAYSRSRSITDFIPMGQPILVGHHSERRHRNDLKRADAAMGKAVAKNKEADDLERRAQNVGQGGVSSDDPEAVAKLKNKLAVLEETRAAYKVLNAAYRKHKGDWGKIQEATGLNAKVIDATQAAMERCNESKPVPAYMLTNLGANVRRIKARIGALEKEADRDEAAPLVGPGYRVEEDKADNRVRFYFDERPTKEVCRKMKAAGFRWSPRAGAWQRHLNNAGRYAAERMAKVLFGTE